MDVWEATRIIARRWFMVLPVLVLTGFAVVALGDRAQPEYFASSTVVMLPPFRTNGETGTSVVNPYLNFNSSLPTTATILRASMARAEIRRLLATEGLAPNYAVVPQDRSPLVDVFVMTDTSERAIATVNRVVALMQDDLRARQVNLRTPRDQVITMQVLAPATGTSLSETSKKRIQYVVVALGLFLAALMAFATEGAMRWYSNRRLRAAREATAGRVAPSPSVAAEGSRVESAR